jgi:hypothetical protein
MKTDLLRPASFGWKWCAVAASLFALTVTLWAQPARATSGVDPSLRVKILLTALSFDRALKQRAGDKVTILSSGTCDTRAVLDAADGKAIGGLPIRTVQAASTYETLTAQALEEKATLLFVCDASGKQLEMYLKFASTFNLLMMVENADLVAKGAALGVVDEGGRPRLVLNPEVSKKAGADFDARILSVAKIVN